MVLLSGNNLVIEYYKETFMIFNPNVISVYAGTPVEEINAIPELFAELQAMSRDCKTPLHSDSEALATLGASDREVYLGTNRPRVREIGERLNKAGGYNLMLWAAKQIPLHDQRELECAWHGIGQWES
jgi:hypothetical protein